MLTLNSRAATQQPHSLGRPVSVVWRLQVLDGLRGLAILLVLLYHLTPTGNSDQGLRGVVFKLGDFGWAGVDLFFVLSGFLITRILLQSKTGPFSISNFVIRRMLRIVPLYYLVLLLVFLVVPMTTSQYSLPKFSEQWPLWLFVSNFFESPSSHEAKFYLGHFWSLGMEMQFYVFWPIAVCFLDISQLKRLLVMLYFLAMILRLVAVYLDTSWAVTFAWTPMRMDALLIGSFLAVLYVNEEFDVTSIRRLVGLLCVLSAPLFVIFWYGFSSSIFKTTEHPYAAITRVGLPSAIALFFGCLVWLSMRVDIMRRSFLNRGLLFLGKYSYGIYIIHFLLLPQFIRFFGPEKLLGVTGHGDAATYLFFLMATSFSIALAVVSYHFFESPILRIKQLFPLRSEENGTGSKILVENA